MDKLLLHNNSMYYEQNHPSRMRSLFHSFEFYHRHRLRKLVPYKHHNSGKHGKGVNVKKAQESFSQRNEHISKGWGGYTLIKGKTYSANRIFTKVGLSYIFSKMSRKKENKLKISPSPPRLTRTFSIHYLECDDYVLPSEENLDIDASKVVSPETDYCMSNELVKTLPSGLDGVQTFKHNGPCGTSNNAISIKINGFGDDALRWEESADARRSSLYGLQSNTEALLTKSGSFPGAGYSGRRITGLSEVSNGQKGDETIATQAESPPSPHLPITMDGILHRIPYGQKASDNMKKEHVLDRYASSKNDIVSLHSTSRNKDAAFSSKSAHRSMQRSRSLTESLDQYSRLFDFSSVGDSEKKSGSLKLLEEVDLQENKPVKSLGRMFSNPEFGTFALDPRSCSTEKPITKKNEEEFTDMDMFTVSSRDKEVLVSTDNLRQSKHNASDDFALENSGSYPSHHQEVRDSVELIDRQKKSNMISVLNPVQLDTVSPAKQSGLEDLDQNMWGIYFEELVSLNGSKDPSSNNQYVPDWIADFSEVQKPAILFTTSHIDVDEKFTAEFQWVRDILQKSGICNETLDGIVSLHQREEALLLGGGEAPNFDFDASGDESQMSWYYELIFDLINEALLKIYGDSFSQFHGFSKNASSIRPLPTGFKLLEEVWSKIKFHLKLNEQINHAPVDVIARDFSNKDGWMNLSLDTELVASELEALILDELLEELLFDDLLSL